MTCSSRCCPRSAPASAACMECWFFDTPPHSPTPLASRRCPFTRRARCGETLSFALARLSALGAATRALVRRARVRCRLSLCASPLRARLRPAARGLARPRSEPHLLGRGRRRLRGAESRAALLAPTGRWALLAHVLSLVSPASRLVHGGADRAAARAALALSHLGGGARLESAGGAVAGTCGLVSDRGEPGIQCVRRDAAGRGRSALGLAYARRLSVGFRCWSATARPRRGARG